MKNIMIQQIIGILIQMYGIPVIINLTIDGTTYRIEINR